MIDITKHEVKPIWGYFWKILSVVPGLATIAVLTAILDVIPGSENLLNNIGWAIIGTIMVISMVTIGLPFIVLFAMASDEYGDGTGAVPQLIYVLIGLAVILYCWATPTIPGTLGIVTGISGLVHVCSFAVLITCSVIYDVLSPSGNDEESPGERPLWVECYVAGFILTPCALIVISFVPLFLQGGYVFFSWLIQA